MGQPSLYMLVRQPLWESTRWQQRPHMRLDKLHHQVEVTKIPATEPGLFSGYNFSFDQFTHFNAIQYFGLRFCKY